MLLIPATEPGNYFILIRGHNQPANTPVTLLAEVLPFQVFDVTPDLGGDSRHVTTRITGAQFHEDAIVKLVRPGISEIEPVRYQVLDSTEIQAIFDLRDAPHGLYDLKVINPDGAEAIVPYRYQVERAIEAEVTVGLGGPRVIGVGNVGTYGVSFANVSNVDTPYTYFQFGIPELGINSSVGLPYLGFSSNLRGQPDSPELADVPWVSLDSAVNTTGQILGPGYALDLPAFDFTGLTFNVHTYPGLTEILDQAFEALKSRIESLFPQYDGILDAGPVALDQIYDGLFHMWETRGNPLSQLDCGDVAFQFPIMAAATPLTRDEFIAQQTAEALKLRDAILADAAASESLVLLASDADAWATLYLAALEDAGILRGVDDLPPLRESASVLSLVAVLSSGILAGPAGESIVTTDNLPDFFTHVRTWYGHDPNLLGSPGIPDVSQFDLGTSAPTHFAAFNVYVPFGECHPEEPGLVDVFAPRFLQYP